MVTTLGGQGAPVADLGDAAEVIELMAGAVRGEPGADVEAPRAGVGLEYPQRDARVPGRADLGQDLVHQRSAGAGRPPGRVNVERVQFGDLVLRARGSQRVRPRRVYHVPFRAEGRVADDAVFDRGDHPLPGPGPERLPDAGAAVGGRDPIEDLRSDDAAVSGVPA